MIPVCNRTLEAKHNRITGCYMWSLVQNILGPYQIYHLLHVTIKTYPWMIWQSRSLFFTCFFYWVFVKWFSSWIYLKYCSLHDKQKSFKYCMFLYREIELLPISLHFLAVWLKILELPPMSHYTNINKIFLKFL